MRLIVLKSYDQATAFLDSLNRLLLALGLAAVLGGSALVFFISHTFTRPLGNLVAGVRALEKGDFTYALDARGGDEVAEVTGAFNRMRASLQKTQQELLEAERLATIGRMASSISHDLTALAGGHRGQRGISVREPAVFRSAGRALPGSSSRGEPDDRSHRFAAGIFAHPRVLAADLRKRQRFGRARGGGDTIASGIPPGAYHVSQEGNSSGWFDPRKLERALYNLLLNSCEAVVPEAGRIHVGLNEVRGGVEIRVSDNGRGIPEMIRGQLFEPFISHGKENGTGLGLTVVQKIVQDHGGDVMVEKTSAEGTVFRLLLPLTSSSESGQRESRGERRWPVPSSRNRSSIPKQTVRLAAAVRSPERRGKTPGLFLREANCETQE